MPAIEFSEQNKFVGTAAEYAISAVDAAKTDECSALTLVLAGEDA